ncbi:hypothetical protein [Ponticoccus alexandrii]|uniref:Uncharacterized protein n=1 Tax=Ponticoccus alexandrii TaxID=1943633 RepID=A0ABX7FEC5_9RHOB|nr:hypothetical protein [Ponticoccus alexandrii]QRF68048.1 hypothetical protein GQA70_18095 [Ponticoccus alexandrii]
MLSDKGQYNRTKRNQRRRFLSDKCAADNRRKTDGRWQSKDQCGAARNDRRAYSKVSAILNARRNKLLSRQVEIIKIKIVILDRIRKPTCRFLDHC